MKITITTATDALIVLHLEGKVSGRWVECLENTCAAELKDAARAVIDLSGVSFLDRAGITLLKNLAECGVEIVNALPFITEQIRNAGPL
ncbi:MAG: STAS domain-containing protein [Candidatus Acidiferrales bacterium]